MSAPVSDCNENNKICKNSRTMPRSVQLCALEYAKCNVIQRKYNQFVLDFCQLAFWREPDSSQQFLDVGCGTGDFTRDILLPRCLPCRRIVGVDCSPEMIEYARHHSAHEMLDFKVLDITADVTEFLIEFGQFERVYSFMCLHWVDDITTAFKNISRLMSPTGECLLVFCAVVQVADVWKALAAMDRWKKYSEMFLKFVPKTQDVQDTKEHLRFLSRLLQEAGLFPTIKEVLISTVFDKWSEDDIHAAYMNTLPVVNLISEEEKSELSVVIRDLIRSVHAPGLNKGPYRMFIVKASKIMS
ncbi:hypothetical protein MTO96_007642 [Rhipicephalus appendiculatus]